MKIIYFKLGSVDTFDHERLSIHLNDPGLTAAQLDYGNADEDIFSALNAGEIIQITEAEYWTIIHAGTPPPDPIVVSTDYLLHLVNSLSACPADSAVFFCYQSGSWWKVPWSLLKSCIDAKINVKVKMGGAGAPIDIDATEYTNLSFINKNMRCRVNGVMQYTRAEWDLDNDPELDGSVDYTDFNSSTGKFTRPAGFKKGELIEFLQV